jgi:hypothetical protein
MNASEIERLVEAVDSAREKHLQLWEKLRHNPLDEKLAKKVWEAADQLGSACRTLYERSQHRPG